MTMFFMPVMMMEERHIKAVGGTIPPDVLERAKKSPEDIYVSWEEGEEAEYFVNTNAVDYDAPVVWEE